MIGLSISFCVLDIARGKVHIWEVDKIIAGTRIENFEEWNELISTYQGSYWFGLDNAEAILRELLEAGKIVQPRLVFGKCPYIGDGHWVAEESQILYV